MRFDDRLATVLSQPVGTPHDRAVRWRQLVDLIARSGGSADPELSRRALDIIGVDRPKIREELRAAAARAIAGAPVPDALLTAFAADTLAVAAPLITASDLRGERLERLRDAASPDVRRLLDSLAPAATPARPAVPDPVPEAELVPTIGDVVARIERLRSSRSEPRPPKAVPPPPRQQPPISPSLFRWECDAGGSIEWVEGAPRGPLVGRSIATADHEQGVDDCVEEAFAKRAPFRDCTLDMGGDGLLAGEWMISGAPVFAPADGRFVGYRGLARRDATTPPLPAAAPGEDASHDALREMIHEIKTPLNAIIGFAEIIDGQYFGPAHRRYRQRAAEIVSNARALMDAAEDLDFVARIQAGRRDKGEGTDFPTFFPSFADGLLERAARLGVFVDLDAPPSGGRCSLEPELTERLLRRFTDAVLGAAAPGEHLAVHVHAFEHRCAMSVTRPKSTILATLDELLDPDFTIGDADRALLGIGFSLRLVNGLVTLAGGGLEIDDRLFTLFVPLAHD